MEQQVPPHPESFFEIIVHHYDLDPSLIGLCAGYEDGEWRSEQCARHLIEWLPEFALTAGEYKAIAGYNAVRAVARAAQVVYTSEKYKRRGELGELILHVAMCQVFKTIPAVSKWYFKDSSNDTVKGFDAVHVVITDNGLELWLGEVKFYDDIKKAIWEVVTELRKHTEKDYLRTEFAAITNKIENDWPHAKKLKKLLDRNTSLDNIFDALCIPILLTYESPTVAKCTRSSEEYKTTLIKELSEYRDLFATNELPKTKRIHLFLFPMASKASLTKFFDERLKKYQEL